MDIPYLFYPSIIDRYLGFSLLFYYYKHCCYGHGHMYARVSFFSIFLDIYLGVRLRQSESESRSVMSDRLFVTPWIIQSMELCRPEYWSG